METNNQNSSPDNRITISKNELYNKLKMVSKVVGPSKTLPILEEFLFTLKNGKLTVTGSNSEGTIIANINCNEIRFSQDISFCLDKTILNAISELPEQPIHISVSDKLQVEIDYANGVFKMYGKDARTYPQISDRDINIGITMNRKELLEGLKTVVPFTSTEDLRPVLCGVYLEKKDSKISFVATDSGYLALKEFDSKTPEVFNSNIPTFGAKLIINIVSIYTETNVEMMISSKNISISTNEYLLIYRLIDGRYPNYNSVIPTSSNLHISTSKVELLSALKRISVFSNFSTKLLKIEAKNKKIIISAEDIDFAISANESIDAEINGEPIAIGFNASKLLEVVNACETDRIVLKLQEPTKAGLIIPEGSEDTTFLLMPMVLNS